MNVVVRSDDGAVSLLVDEIGDVVEVEEAPSSARRKRCAARIRTMITGVHKLNDRLMLVLDTEQGLPDDGGNRIRRAVRRIRQCPENNPAFASPCSRLARLK